jgi:hypothetical protein
MESASLEVRPSHKTKLVSLVRLKQCKCKWPVMRDVRVVGCFLFCGRQTDGHSYCAKHQALNVSARKYRAGMWGVRPG